MLSSFWFGSLSVNVNQKTGISRIQGIYETTRLGEKKRLDKWERRLVWVRRGSDQCKSGSWWLQLQVQNIPRKGEEGKGLGVEPFGDKSTEGKREGL